MNTDWIEFKNYLNEICSIKDITYSEWLECAKIPLSINNFTKLLNMNNPNYKIMERLINISKGIIEPDYDMYLYEKSLEKILSGVNDYCYVKIDIKNKSISLYNVPTDKIADKIWTKFCTIKPYDDVYHCDYKYTYHYIPEPL